MNHSAIPRRTAAPGPVRALAGGAGVALALLAGCTIVHPPPQPLTPAEAAAALETRSLQDDGLRRFLAQNGREAGPTWDLETLCWVAFYYNPTLAVARAGWGVAQAGVRTAEARPNPSVTLTPGYNTNAPAGLSPWFPALGADLPFETAGKRAKRADVARLSAESSRLAVFAAAWQVRAEVRGALDEFAFATEKSARLSDELDLARQLLGLLEQRLAAGTIAAADLAGARLAVVRAETDAADAQRELPLARQHLAAALGLPAEAVGDARLAAPPVPAAPGGEALAAARRLSLQNRADVRGALARYEASQAALALEVARQYPDLHLGPGYQWDQGADKWSLALTLELPLFNHNEGPIAEAVARRSQAAAEFTAVQAGAIAAIDRAAAAQQAAAAHLASLDRLQAELQRQVGQAEARLAAGSADRLELLTARLDAATNQSLLADARAQAASAAGELEDALQVPAGPLDALLAVPSATSGQPSP